MIAVNVDPWERSHVSFVDAGVEALRRRDEAYLVVNLPTRGIPGCCSKQLVGVESVGRGESVDLCEV